MKFFLLLFKVFRAIIRFLFWHSERLIPRNKNKWVFGSWFGEKYSDNSRAMYEYVLREMPDIKATWLTSNIDVYNKLKVIGRPVEMLSSFKGKMTALTSKFAFITVERKEVNGYYLNGAKLIWLYHGMPMKMIMNDERRFIKGETYDRPSLKKKLISFFFPYSGNNYNVGSVLTTSSFFNPFFESAFKVDSSKVWMDGYPRNDVFFSTEVESLVVKFRKLFPTAKFIIHMPTHRVHGLSGQPFNPFDGYGFDVHSFYEMLEEGDYVYFYKGHYYDTGNLLSIHHDRFVKVSDDDFDDLYRLVKDMDLLITDYSSIYFDFLLLQRPIILTPFDYSEYIKQERPLYFDYYKYIKANIVNNWSELDNLLLNKLYKQPSYDVIRMFHNNIDGLSCERISKHIEQAWM